MCVQAQPFLKSTLKVRDLFRAQIALCFKSAYRCSVHEPSIFQITSQKLIKIKMEIKSNLQF